MPLEIFIAEPVQIGFHIGRDDLNILLQIFEHIIQIFFTGFTQQPKHLLRIAHPQTPNRDHTKGCGNYHGDDDRAHCHCCNFVP